MTSLRPTSSELNELLTKLKELFADRASTSEAIREHHGHGEGLQISNPPDMVVFAHSTEEVATIVKLANACNTPVIPFGTGTSLEGHVNAIEGGISIDLSAMDQVIEVNQEDLDCRVQAGVCRVQLNEFIRDTGLFFPIDPGANASLGGMAATRASGTNAVRYGTMRENVLGLTVVTSDGKIIKTGGRARKSSAGYDLTRLYVGSEGTLGVITEIQLRLYGIPEAISSAVCQFPDLETAVNTTILTIQSGIPVARIELLDELQMGACINYSKLEGYEAKTTLFFEFHGSTASVKEQAEAVQAISEDFGGSAFKWVEKQEDRTKLWQTRHDAYYAAKSLGQNKGIKLTDVCVPISSLAECILETQKDIAENDLIAPIVGHVGDGNFHLTLMYDQESAEEKKRAYELVERLNERAVSFGGTCTGEHGIGIGKVDFLHKEHGGGVDVMRMIKNTLDPKNIMNPGKVLSS